MGAEQVHGQWVILAVGDGIGVCPDCGKQSERRRGWHERHLQDLPAQGAAVTVKLRIQRWQCRNKACKRQTFASQLPEIAAPLARRTARATELVHLFGHGVGGRPGERLLKRLGMPTSDDTILRHLKRRAKANRTGTSIRVVGLERSYDVVVIDCPPQLGFLTLSALCAATAVLVTVHPQMLDVMSMCQFLIMTSDLLNVVAKAGGNMEYDWLRYLVTRYEPIDGPQTQMVGFMRSLFGERMLTNQMVKSTAISDAGITKQTLYEVSREQFTRATYDRAIEALENVNGEIEGLICKAWGR